MTDTMLRRHVRRLAPIAAAAMLAALAVAPQPAYAEDGPAKPTAAELALTPQPAAQVTSQSIVTENIYNPNSGRCIGISNIKAGIWDCTSNGDQRWHWSIRGAKYEDGLWWYPIENAAQQCLALWGGALDPGTWAVGYECVLSDDQYWRVFTRGGITYLANLAGFQGPTRGWILGVNGGLTTNGAQIVLYWIDGTQNQNWSWQVA
ncbi:RICIN domain-containing protein [Dactylosporangium vinaceum]|uniref:RICIN domain-containing protein n=1 Tax=Dactylosporangium vinaceum TaxID=53362 RepID=A0ABV5M1Y7_9ACTN|nr:RICIN domain-containing protein [Dactylosporangium vinaceum]UAB99360.1 RICIN domain-containing protein [Dactylosporangium vinaceum]